MGTGRELEIVHGPECIYTEDVHKRFEPQADIQNITIITLA